MTVRARYAIAVAVEPWTIRGRIGLTTSVQGAPVTGRVPVEFSIEVAIVRARVPVSLRIYDGETSVTARIPFAAQVEPFGGTGVRRSRRRT